MSREESNWQGEQRRVNTIISQIHTKMAVLEDEVGQVKSDVVDIRKHFWDDVSINLGNSNEITETFASMKQQAEVLLERELRHRQSTIMLTRLTRLSRSPYFGRIDFIEEGCKVAESIYLGIASFLEEDSGRYLVYDWRAPISSLYYDYSPGEASYMTPSGEVKGTMTLKRQFVIRDGKISLMFDTGVTIGDEMLQQVLSRSSDAQMKSIVATIQKEQNRVIRNESARMLIVQGVAGSGKTSSALQRVAYLLYKHRETLRADQLVLFSPNPLFNSYVSTVLPELGEENMQQTTLQEYVEHRLGQEYAVEDPFSQIEYVLSCRETPGYSSRIEGISFKSSICYLNVVLAYRDLLEWEKMIFRAIRLQDRIVVSSERIQEKFYGYDPAIRLVNRMVLIREWLLKELAEFAELLLQEDWVEDEMELLDADTYQDAYRQLKASGKAAGSTFDDFDKEKDILARKVVKQHLKPLNREIKHLGFVDIKALYTQLFADESLFGKLTRESDRPKMWTEICRQTLERLQRSELAYEDAAPLLYLGELVLGFQTNTLIRHVIIDEAQDYSPFQLHYLKQLFPRAKMTALGDRNQAIYAHASMLGEQDPIKELYGEEQTERIELTRSYRSTREIVEFTRGIVPGGEDIEPFNRGGDKPLVVVAADVNELWSSIAADAESLRAEGFESIALICKTAKEAEDAFLTLQQRMELQFISKEAQGFEKGIVILPAYLAKGVEFDAVIMVNGSLELYSHEQERKLFYTACTRAMHLLHIYVMGKLSPFIAAQPPATYELTAVRPKP